MHSCIYQFYLSKMFKTHDLSIETCFQVNQMFTNFPLDVAGNLDYKNLCYVITHGEDKEQE